MADTAKVFWTGRSQAVRLPKQFRFTGDEVHIHRREDGAVVLTAESAQAASAAPPAEAAATAIDRMRVAIVRGLDSGPAEPWDAAEIKAAGRRR